MDEAGVLELRWGRTIDQKWPQCVERFVRYHAVKVTSYSLLAVKFQESLTELALNELLNIEFKVLPLPAFSVLFSHETNSLCRSVTTSQRCDLRSQLHTVIQEAAKCVNFVRTRPMKSAYQCKEELFSTDSN
jgi:hypothetical protein